MLQVSLRGRTTANGIETVRVRACACVGAIDAVGACTIPVNTVLLISLLLSIIPDGTKREYVLTVQHEITQKRTEGGEVGGGVGGGGRGLINAHFARLTVHHSSSCSTIGHAVPASLPPPRR